MSRKTAKPAHVEPGLEEPFLPQEVTDLDRAFPARGVELTPRDEDIPQDFPNRSAWEFFASALFSSFVADIQLLPAEGIDPAKAWRHIEVCLGTFGTRHERKIAGIAFLLSRWFVAARWLYRADGKIREIDWPEFEDAEN